MSKFRILPFVISILFFIAAGQGDDTLERTKRQAPSINVHQIPKTSFSCADRKIGEYYADPETGCQVYHVCVPGMHNKMSLISFVCPNGTIFSQATRVCTPYDRVDCSLTTKFYDSINGQHDSGRHNSELDDDYDNYVPQPPPRQPAQPPRQPAQPPRQSAPARNRNTPAPPPPPPAPVPVQPSRNTRFRGAGNNQFRGQQAPPVTTPAPVRATTPAPVARAPVASVRPAPPSFRSPVLAARPPQSASLANVLPPRPTVRAVVSTSTSSYNYEYEYDYEYEDDAANPEQPNARNKREATASDEYDSENPNFEGNFPETSFTCEDKLPGGAYTDTESNCEMFHICVLLGKYKILDYKVKCANGTAFDQETGSCRDKDEFVCKNAELFYPSVKPNQPKSTKKPVSNLKKFSNLKKSNRPGKE